MASILPPKLRGVSSKTPDPTEYIEAIQRHLTGNQVYARSITIFEAARQHPTAPERLVITINKLDRSVTRAMIMAEERCRSKPRPEWSAALAAASRTVQFWKISISGQKTNTDVSTILNSIGVALKWDNIPKEEELGKSKSELKLAYKKLNECRKEATTLRKAFIDDQIEAAALAEDSTKEKILKQIKHKEAQAKCFGNLANALKPAGSQGGVTKVEVIVDGEAIAYKEKRDVEHEIQKRNPKHFNQPAGSPFTIQPLSEVGVSSTKFKTTHLPDGTKVKMPVDTFLETETVLDLL
jgi:hypothetical protein